MHSHLNPLLLISAALKTSLMNSSTELDTHPLSNKTVEAFYYSPFHLFLSAHPSHVLPSVSFCNQSLSPPPPRSVPLPALARCVDTPSNDFSLRWLVRTFQHLGWGGGNRCLCCSRKKNAHNEPRSLQRRASKKQKHFISGDLRWHHFTWLVFGVIEQLVRDATAVASLFSSVLFCSVTLSNVLLTNTTNYFTCGASVGRRTQCGFTTGRKEQNTAEMQENDKIVLPPR